MHSFSNDNMVGKVLYYQTSESNLTTPAVDAYIDQRRSDKIRQNHALWTNIGRDLLDDIIASQIKWIF